MSEQPTAEQQDGGPRDTYQCEDCGHTETVEPGATAGDAEDRTFGSGRRERTQTVLVCPKCGSKDWLSDSIRELAETVEKGVSDL